MGPKSYLLPTSKYPRMPVSISTADESYFGDKRKGKRGRGATGKAPMFGILRRRGKVYTKGYSRCFINNIIPHY